MALQYKPTKPKKEKPQKPPKEPKREKEVKLGGAVKLDTAKPEKQKKIKEPKLKAQKAEKIKPVNIQKPEKAEKFEASSKLKKPLEKKTVIIIAVAALVVIAAALALFLLIPDGSKPQGGDAGVSSVVITEQPKRTEFYVGESPSYVGLQVRVTLNSGLTYTVDEYKCTFSGFDSSAPAENQKITVTYNGKSAHYYVTIKERPAETDAPGMFNGLTIKTLPKTEFKVGDWPSAEGGVLIYHYDNGYTEEIPMEIDQLYGFNTSAPGKYTVSVKIVKDGFLATATYEITVTE